MKITWISAAFLAFVCFFHITDAQITAWSVPEITDVPSGTGTLTVQENQAADTTIVTITATSNNEVTYTLSPAVSPFALASAGALTITAALDYATTPTYTLIVLAEDSTASSTATATITVTVNTAPAFATTYSPCIADGSTVDATVVTVDAADPNGDTLTYDITGSDFKIDASSGLIQVATGTIDKASTPTFDIVVTAADSTFTATVTVSATVMDVCSSAVGAAVSLMVFLAALMVNIF